MQQAQPSTEFSASPHKVAWLLVGATFPLIWVGGLVTTYDAGMAVPDWPSTYGYNLFLYPWQTWVAGPWDLFIEHGHRLLGALVGLIAIAFVWIVWRRESRKWLRWLSVAALLLVILQGVLGGQRVLQDDRRIAQIHGVVGPTFFALTVILTAFTSRWWRTVGSEIDKPNSQSAIPPRLGGLVVASWLTFGLAFAQLVLGSQLRHGVEYSAAGVFRVAVVFHVVLAILLMCQVCYLAAKTWWRTRERRLRAPAAGLLLLISCQLLLGLGSWTVKYGWPAILQGVLPQPSFIVQAKSMSQSLIVTGHMATGALILACAGLLAVRATRLAVGVRRCPARSVSDAANMSLGVLV